MHGRVGCTSRASASWRPLEILLTGRCLTSTPVASPAVIGRVTGRCGWHPTDRRVFPNGSCVGWSSTDHRRLLDDLSFSLPSAVRYVRTLAGPVASLLRGLPSPGSEMSKSDGSPLASLFEGDASNHWRYGQQVRGCPACATPNQDDSKFCAECGARLPVTGIDIEQRKTVTILFADITGSTALGERMEPEVLRRMLSRFFEAARSVVESHGGTVEKFIGDAVLAIFGVPVLHEDDALRALRAALDMMATLRSLNDDLERDYGAALQIRVGVNTGEWSPAPRTGSRPATPSTSPLAWSSWHRRGRSTSAS